MVVFILDLLKFVSQVVSFSRGCLNRCPNIFLYRPHSFKYLGTTTTNQNFIHEEIKSRLNSGNGCHYSVQNLLSSPLLSKNVKIKGHRSIILPVDLYMCET
jgi:hypothetical protein